MLPQQLHRLAFGSQNLIAELLGRFSIPKRKLVVDFSSPNIAKTFHVGNLRSTLLGNFVQKIARLAGHEVVALNYLGDWGQQFSLLACYWTAVMDGQEGRQQRPSAEQWAQMDARQRVEMLTSAYASANRMSKLNPAFSQRSRQLYLGMEATRLRPEEQGEEKASPEVRDALELWRECTRTSRTYLDAFYARFGVHFDEWDAESAHVEAGNRLVDELIEAGHCRLAADDLWIVDNKEGRPGLGTIGLRRGDGANLYLNRELAAFYARHARHQADQYIYVVDVAQHPHFAYLKQLLCLRGDDALAERVNHYKFGRVIGLSTREGKNDSVDYLIEQGMREASAYVESSYTKRSTEDEQAQLCAALALSQLVYSLVQRHKHSDFTFSYRGAFAKDGSGTSALLLQQKYSRLNSLELANREHVERLQALDDGALLKMRPDMSEQAQKLARMLIEFDTVLHHSLERLEPAPVTIYLLRLSNLVGKARGALRVQGEPLSVALPRMLLFSAAKRVLGDGMRLVGMEPVEKM